MHRQRCQLVAASTAILLTMLAACSGESEDSAGAETSPAASSSPSDASISTAGSAEEIFTEVLEENRVVDHDPGDEPDPEIAYAAALEEHEADLLPCGKKAETSQDTCAKPASMGQELKETVNVQLLLDASGSMADALGSRTKMEIAREVLIDFVATLPKTANVSLRVFGHVGTGSGADKARSCRTTELVMPFRSAGSPGVERAIRAVDPSGWTPLANAMQASRRDFAKRGGSEASNYVYVVSDGVETCGGDPVNAARSLGNAGVGVDVGIVGFDVDKKASEQLRRSAEAAGGQYTDASGADELADAFDSYNWAEWTRYYNCKYGLAHGNYNASYGVAHGNYNCVYAAMHGEFNAIYADTMADFNLVYNDAHAEFNKIYNAVHAADLDADLREQLLQLGRERRDALVETSRVIREEIIGVSKQRREAILDAAKNKRVDLLDQAQAERDRILDEAKEARDRAAD